MKYGVLIGRHSALSVCQQNGPAVMSKSSTMEAVSAVLKAERATLFFEFFLTDFTRSDLSETYLPRFVAAAHESEQPLSDGWDVQKHYQSHHRHYKAASHLRLVLLHLHSAFRVKAACARRAEMICENGSIRILCD